LGLKCQRLHLFSNQTHQRFSQYGGNFGQIDGLEAIAT
jgi:hypothetical protein